MPATQDDHIGGLGFRIWPAQGPGLSMRRAHTHPDVEVNYLITGHVRYFMGRCFEDLNPGDIAVFWAGIPHQTLIKSEDLNGVWITLPLQWLLRWKHAAPLAERLMGGAMVIHPASEAEKLLFPRWVDDFTTEDPVLRDIVATELEAEFSRISRALMPGSGAAVPTSLRRPGGPVGRVEEITHFLAVHYTDDLTVDEVAAAVKLHPKYLLALFRRNCGMTLWEYVLRLRLAHAQRLLLTTESTVLDVALEAGFGSLSAFYHAYRQHGPPGTPASFRAQGR